MDYQKKIGIEYSVYSGISLYIMEKRPDGIYHGAVTFTKANEGEHMEPTYRLSEEQAKQLAVQLSQIGYVTSDDAGELKATKYHLEDMRLLACVNKQTKQQKERS